MRCSSDLVLLWLWGRPAAAAPIQPLAQKTSICHRCSHKKKKIIIICGNSGTTTQRKHFWKTPTLDKDQGSWVILTCIRVIFLGMLLELDLQRNRFNLVESYAQTPDLQWQGTGGHQLKLPYRPSCPVNSDLGYCLMEW